MKKIHLLATLILIGGVSCLHVKREKIHSGSTFSWWPKSESNETSSPMETERIKVKDVLSETVNIIRPDKNTVVVGGRLEQAYDHPGDNSVRFLFDEEPDSNALYALEYELNGAGHPAELLLSWNDELCRGGSWVRPVRQWNQVTEFVHPNRLQKGENVLRFNRHNTNGFYELRNIRLRKFQTLKSENTLVLDEKVPVYDSNAVIRLYTTQRIQLQVEGKSYDLQKGHNMLECKLDMPLKTIQLLAKTADGKVQTLTVQTEILQGAQQFSLEKEKAPDQVQAFSKTGWIYEGDFVNLTAQAESVTEDVQIIIQPLRKLDLPPLAPGMINVTAGASGYRLLPDNIQFKENIRLSLRIDSALVPRGFSLAHVRTYYFDEEKRSWIMLPQDSLEKSGLWAGAYTDHFTDFINAIIKAPELPTNQAHVPTSFSGLSAANPLEGVNQISAPSANSKGDLALTFPIEIPKGRNGLEPSLQLTYNSSGGNGYFGLGWNMSFPNIQVDTRWGVPRYSTTAESEAYLVNGEQLEEVAHQILLNSQRNPNPVKEYRYRVEGKFDKILRHGTNPLNYTWEVHEKSGRIYYYGKKKTETNVNPSCVLKGTNGIAYWALAEVEDQHGNQIVYSYAYNSNAIARIPIPNNIQYSLSNSGANSYIIKFTTLINGDPPSNIITQNRPDASIDMRFGFPVAMDNLVKGISVYFDTEHIRSYFLNYKEGAFKKSLLCNILEHTQLGQEPSVPTLDGIQNIMQGSCSAGEDESFTLAGNQKLHRFSYENFDIQSKSIFGPPASLGGSTKPLQLLSISDNGGNVRSSVDFLELIKYPLGLLTLQEKGTLSQSRTINLGGNAGLYAGLGANVFAKSNSITGSLGGSMGWSRTTVGFFDIDGDGYPDRIYKTSNGYYYQTVKPDGNTFSLNANELALIDLKAIASSNSFQWSWGVQGQALGLFNANYNKSKSTTITDQYFADVDADGFVDLVDGQYIWYNRNNPNGGGRKFEKPTSNIVYVDNCNYIDQTGQIDPDLGKEFDFPVGVKELEIEKKLADQNTVSVWVAPRNGTVNVESNISMKNPDFVESWQHSYANGIQFRIQHNGVEIVSDSLMNDEFSPTKYHNRSFSVQPGDLIFFRLLSKGNREFDDVDWLRKITYVENNSSDADGLSNIEFNSEGDFLANQDQKLQMPFDGIVEISLGISSTTVSEDLQLKIQKNNDPPIETEVFLSGGTISYSFLQDLEVAEGDFLLFELIGKSKIDYTKLQIDPIVRYKEIDGSPMPTNSEWAEVKIIPIVNFKPLGRNFAKSISNSISGGSYTVTPQLIVTGNYTGEVYLTAKLLNASLGGMTIQYNSGNITYPNGSSFNISLSSVQNVYFDYSFSNPIESFGITQHNVSISGSLNYNFTAGVYMPYDSMFKKFGTLYRGWGQFVYAGVQEDPIDLNLLNSNLESYVAGLPAVNGELDLAPGIGNTPATAGDMEATAMSSHAQAFLNNPFYEMYVDSKNNEWYAPGAYGRVSKKYLYNTLRLNELESKRISNPIPVATSSHNGKAILKKHIQETKTWGAGVGPSILRAGGTKSEGIGKILSDFRDMNGDGYPDNMSFEKIQFTNPRGGLQLGGSADFPSSFNSTSNKSYGTSLGGGPKAWSKEVNTYILSTEGWVHTQSETESTTVGGSVGWGDSRENIGLFDFNGDGLPDLLLDNKWVRLNRGYGFETSRNWDLTIDVSESASLSYGPDVGFSFVRKMLVQKSEDSWSFGLSANRSENNVLTIPIDINGDGLLDFLTTAGGTHTDLVLHLNTGLKYEIYNSVGWSGDDYTPKSETNSIGGNGSSSGGVTGGLFKFGANIALSLNFAFSRDRGTFIDVNNDGYVDYVEDEPLNNKLKVHYNQIGKTNLLRKVETVTGVTMEFNYEPLITSVEMPKSKWLFTELIVDDKFAADSNGQSRFTYTYHNPNYHRFERVFLGFDSVITNQWGGNDVLVQKRERFHNQDIYFTGLKYRESLVNPTTSPIQYWIVKTFVYKHHSIATGAVLTNPACGDPFYPALESEITLLTEGLTTTDFWTKKSYTRGPKGVITGFVDIGDQADASDDYSALIEYTESTTRYIVGLPTRIRVYSGSTLLREREATYNNVNGNLTSMRVLLSGPSGSGQYAVDDFQYDSYGNITKQIFPPNANGQRYEMTYTYDNVLYSFPVSVSDYWGLTNTFTYNYLLGKPITFTDAYGGITSYQYNFNGKTLSITGPKEQSTGGSTLDYAYWDDVPYDYPLNVKTYWAETRHFDPVTPPIRTILFTDGLGYQLQVKKTAFVADNANSSPTLRWIVSGWQSRDQLGRVLSQWYPTTSNVSSGSDYVVLTTADVVQPTVFTYDFLNRPISKKYPDGTVETMVYSLSNQNGPYTAYTGVIDDLGNTTVVLKDIQGNTLESIRNQSNTTKFTYSPLGELLSSIDPESKTTQYSYDKGGRIIGRVHPDAGTDITQYDAAGNITVRQRNKQHLIGSHIHYGYSYNRLLEIAYPENPENNVFYEYGTSGYANGRILRIEDASGAQEFEYGNMGEVVKKTTTLLDLNQFAYTFSSFWEYDSWGRIKRLVYPDGEEVEYSYDQGGKLIRIRQANLGDRYLENVWYDKFENKLKEELGNGTVMKFDYSSDMRRLSNLKAGYQGTEFLDVTYTYDQVGNIVAIVNGAQAKDNIGGPFSHEYTYDNLYRLSVANGSNGSAFYELNMSYSPSGNILEKKVRGDVLDISQGLMTIDYNNEYAYDPTKPHQVTAITDQNSGNTSNFEWDDNGNMALHSDFKNGYTLQRRMCWDEENRLMISADEEQMAGYIYDAGGIRTHKASGTVAYSTVNGYPNSFASISAFTLYPSELITVSSTMYTKHYYNGTSRIASRVGGGFSSHPDLTYDPLNDHIPLPSGLAYEEKSQTLIAPWTRNAACAGLNEQMEFSYSMDVSYQFTNPGPDGERYFYHSDHLGSSAFITSENGYATQFLAYLPYGETLAEQQNSTSYYSPFKFSAKEKDPETGYSYFGARYYSPELSVWLSVDPMADHPNQVDKSPYAYAWNNPVKYIDPDGQLPIIPIIAGIWALAEIGMSAYDAYDTGKTMLDPDKTASEKWLAGGLFIAGVVFPGGGYSQLDNLGKWGIKSTQAVQRVNQRAQKATNMLFGKNKDINISLGGVSSQAEANAIGETIVGKLTYNSKKGWNEGTKVINNKEGEFKIHFRGPADKKYDTGGNMVANLQMYKSSISETGKKIWTEVKNVHIEVQ